MIRNYKALGLALMAMCAFGAVAVEGASASPLTVHGIAAGQKAYFTGENDTENHVFSTPNGTVKCTTTHFLGSGKVEPVTQVHEVSIEPIYEGCTAFGFATAHVKVNGCTYTFTTPTSVKTGEVTWGPSQIHILCPAGKSIEITPTSFGISACTQFVGEQTPTGGHIVGTNAGTATAMHVTLAVTLKEIHYTGTGGLCGNGETHKDATYNGNSTVTCFSDEKRTVRAECTFS
jgi:hypothetical protein